MSNGFSVQEKKLKIDFKDGGHGENLGFLIGTILATFDVQVTPCFLASFNSIDLLIHTKKRKIDFQEPPWRPSWVSDRNELSYFYIQSTPMLPIKFQVSWPFESEEDTKNMFSRWPPQQTSWISDRKDFSYILFTNHLDASYKVSSQLDLRFRRRSEKNFRNRHYDGYIVFPIGTILAIFDLQITPMLPTKFQVN